MIFGQSQERVSKERSEEKTMARYTYFNVVPVALSSALFKQWRTWNKTIGDVVDPSYSDCGKPSNSDISIFSRECLAASIVSLSLRFGLVGGKWNRAQSSVM